MGVFKPNIQCRGTFDTALSCRDVLADMPASTEMEVFGPRDAPFVKEVLPQEVVSGKKSAPLRRTCTSPQQLTMIIMKGDDKCIVKLFSTGTSDIVAWYSIWEAVEATFAMCARQLQGGGYRGLG